MNDIFNFVANWVFSFYRIKFFFDENPFFENDSITKEFHLGTTG